MLHGWKEDSKLIKALQHIPIRLQPFTSYIGLASYWSEIATFPLITLAFNARVGGDPLARSSWFSVCELPDGQATTWCKNISEKLTPLSRVHACLNRIENKQINLRSKTDRKQGLVKPKNQNKKVTLSSYKNYVNVRMQLRAKHNTNRLARTIILQCNILQALDFYHNAI